MFESEPIQCDHVPIEKRVEVLKGYILPDIESSTNGAVSIARLLSASKTLDIGCGSGAYVRALTELGASGKFIGVDFTKYYTENAYEQYDQLVIGDIRQEEVLKQLYEHEFDTIISIGVPPKIVKFIYDNRHRLKMTTEGLLVVVTDSPIQEKDYPDFQVFPGRMGIDKNILIPRKKI